MKLKPKTRNQLVLISLLLNKAQKAFQEIDDLDAEAIFNFHNENASLNHCLHWGTQAAENLLETSKTKEKRKCFRRIDIFDTISEIPTKGCSIEGIIKQVYDGYNMGNHENLGEINITAKETEDLLLEMSGDPTFFDPEH